MARLLVLITLLLLPVFHGVAAQAVFAGGSFWVMEALFAGRPGVTQVEPGWMWGETQLPHRQVVRVHYSESALTYGDLLHLYWQAVDAHDADGQYCDRGSEFSPALYVQGPLQLKWARQSRARLRLERERPLQVRILPVSRFIPAPDRHWHYYRQHPLLYWAYRKVCGYPDGQRLSMRPLLTGPLPASRQ